MSESNEYKWLRTNIVRPPNRIERIENVIGVGTFDCNYCVRGDEGWLEIKAPTEPKRPSTPLFGSNHKVSQDQANWALSQRKAGGRAMFWIGTDRRRLLMSGSLADQLNKMTVTELVEESLWHRLKSVRLTDEDKQELIECLRA